jgi:hypothetical protein
MVLVAVTVLGALAVGYLRGGQLRNLGTVRLRRGWLVLASVGIQGLLAAFVALGGPGEALSRPLLLASQVALLAFVWCNRLLPGMTLVFVGFAANAAVITANGAMPVDPDALAMVGGGSAVIEPGKHRLLTEGDSLVWLADILPIPLLRTVISAGDIVLAAGVGILVVNLMRAYPPPPGRRSRTLPPDEPAVSP